MIESLTPEQEAKLQEYADRWAAIGLSTEPADRPRAERAIEWMYKQANMDKPEIVWSDSPMSMALTIVVLKNSDWDSVTCSIMDSVKDSVRNSVKDSVRNSIMNTVKGSVRNSIRDSIMNTVEDTVWDTVFGQHDAHWLAFYRYFHDIGLRDETEAMFGLWEMAQATGWWAPYENICFVSERHNILNRDQQGRLHCEDGLACGYPDGWGVYAWHGVRMDEWMITKPRQNITAEQIMSISNVEQRRALLERVGYDVLLSAAEKIDSDMDTHHPRNLYRIAQDNDEDIVVIQLQCPSTGRIYVERVPPSMTTCQKAVNWQYGVDGDAEIVRET